MHRIGTSGNLSGRLAAVLEILEMPHDSWIRRLTGKVLLNRIRSNQMFLEERSFRFELARERMRVDRGDYPLALLVIELPTNRATARDLDFLGRTLIRRIRTTDTIGILSEGRIGVLLPDTPKAGAWKVASDICSKYPVGLDRPNCFLDDPVFGVCLRSPLVFIVWNAEQDHGHYAEFH